MSPPPGGPSPPTPWPRTHWPAVLAATLGGVAVGMNVGKVPLALPTLRDELGLSLVQAGWVSSMLTTLAIVAALGFGLAAGRIGALRMVLGGLGISALASAVGAWVPAGTGPGFGLLLTTRFFEGAGFLAVSVAGPALISAAAAPADRRFALSVWAAYMPAGAGLAMALSPLLLPTLGWRGLWAVTAALLLLAAVLATTQRRWYAAAGASSHVASSHVASSHVASTATPASGTSDAALAILRQPLPWLLALAFGVWAIQHFALIVWLPTFLTEQRGLGAGRVALLTGLMLLACVPGNLLGGLLLQRGVARGPMLAVAHSLTGLCALGFFFDGFSDGLRYGLCVALSFIGGVIPAAVMGSSTVLARNPRQTSALQGLFMQGSQLGQGVGTPLIAAVVAASGSWASAGWVTAGAATTGIALGLAAWGVERHLARR